MTPVRTAHQSFKARYPRNLEICLSVGLLIHLAMIVFTPPMEIAPYKMEIMEDPFQMRLRSGTDHRDQNP